mmetsp:Transcript_49808/g.121582  ORF Transcript_49808/g.121582 Transcript_49808/m.121582 type:complete len:255 (+) Transcript_49808:163-927(+)
MPLHRPSRHRRSRARTPSPSRRPRSREGTSSLWGPPLPATRARSRLPPRPRAYRHSPRLSCPRVCRTCSRTFARSWGVAARTPSPRTARGSRLRRRPPRTYQLRPTHLLRPLPRLSQRRRSRRLPSPRRTTLSSSSSGSPPQRTRSRPQQSRTPAQCPSSSRVARRPLTCRGMGVRRGSPQARASPASGTLRVGSTRSLGARASRKWSRGDQTSSSLPLWRTWTPAGSRSRTSSRRHGLGAPRRSRRRRRQRRP